MVLLHIIGGALFFEALLFFKSMKGSLRMNLSVTNSINSISSSMIRDDRLQSLVGRELAELELSEDTVLYIVELVNVLMRELNKDLSVKRVEVANLRGGIEETSNPSALSSLKKRKDNEIIEIVSKISVLQQLKDIVLNMYVSEHMLATEEGVEDEE